MGIKLAVTGHRPNKMYGYDLTNVRWLRLKERFKELLVELDCEEGFSGMALGVDMVWALAILELKDEGYNIKLHCAIPCRNQSCKWPRKSVELYNSILDRADVVTLVSDDYYSPYLMQKRNEFMVDNVDKVIAVWDGSSGGTGNCVNYANRVGKEIIRILPNDIV